MSKILVLTALFASVAAADLEAQRRGSRATATFAVVVADPDGTPLGDVLVTVEGTASRSARTEAGRIAFENLPAGPYTLRFEREGFLTLERELTARGGAPMDVKVTLKPAPKPVAPPPPPPAPAVEPPPSDAKPFVLDLPGFIAKNYIGRGAGKTLPLACTTDGHATLLQLNAPLADRVHAAADEFLYVVAGEGTVRMQGRQDRLQAGVLLMIPRGLPHTLAPAGKNPLVLLSTRAGEGCGAH